MSKKSSPPRSSSRSPMRTRRGGTSPALPQNPVSSTPPSPITDTSWVGIGAAAAYLGLSASRLRKTLERYSREVDGSIHSEVDGVVAQKFGRLWRVRFSAAWLRPEGT